MLVDYMLEFPCAPRRHLGEELTALLRRLPRFRAEPAEAGVSSSRGSRWGLSAAALADAREAGFRLRPLAFHCARCPANHAGREFGCFEAIRLPISAEAEEWLIGRLPPTLEDRPRRRDAETPAAAVRRESARRLLDRLRELPGCGAALEAERATGHAVERPRAVVRRYGLAFRARRVSSAQLLDLLLFRGGLEPETGELVCRALGLWEDGGIGADGLPEAVFTQPVEPDDDASVAELKRFFHAAMVAASLGARVVTCRRGAAAPISETAQGPCAPSP